MSRKPKKSMDEADSSRIYKRARKSYISKITGKCSRCGYHRGENLSRKPSRNWKELRRGKQWEKG